MPLEQNEKYKYMIDLKRFFQTFMEDSPYYVKPVETKKDIHRYSDKYKLANTATTGNDMICESSIITSYCIQVLMSLYLVVYNLIRL